MQRALWDARANRCGVVYNPLTISTLLQTTDHADLEPYIIKHTDHYVNLLLMSDFAAATREECINIGMNVIRALHRDIAESQALIVTLGTARVFKHLHTGLTVGNCHKISAKEFEERLLPVEEVSHLLCDIEESARSISGREEYPVIFTVSPVRHTPSRPHANTLSKATLQLATRGHEYFEAYELLIDDLRDYRFYAADMVHPSDMAVQYIWERFLQRYLSQKDADLIARGEALHRRLNHRQMQFDTPEAEAFRAQTKVMLAEFESLKREGEKRGIRN